MRIHHLRFGALGPFLGEADIDFEALAANGLFLIEGPTGSGKSTIIDAIAFALYGETAGTTSNDRLVSDFRPADSASVPYAELTFETAGQLWRVRRVARHERAKKVGTGTTRQAAQAFLYAITPEQVHSTTDSLPQGPVGATPQEVGPLVQASVGLNARQFAQTVVLPQGEFATFLGAASDQRRLLLERLFATGLYSDIGVALDTRARAVLAATDAAAAEVLGGLRKFVEAAGLDEAHEASLVAVRDRADDLLPALERHCLEVAQRADSARDALTAAAELLREARADHLRATELHSRVARRREAEARQSALTLAQPAVDEALAAVEALGRAAIPGERLRALLASERACETATRERDHALAQAADVAGLTADQCDQQRATLERQTASLGPLVVAEGDLPRRQLECETRQSRRADVLREQVATDQRLGLIPARRQELDDRRVVLAAKASTIDILAAQHQSIVERLAAARMAEALATSVLEAEGSVADAARVWVDAEADQVRLARLHRASVAVMLAAGLVEGEPCQVCGSVEHPAPALADGDLDVSLDMVDAAVAVTQSARDRHEASANELRSILHQRALAEGRAEGDVAGLVEAAAVALTAVEEARAAGAEVAEVEEALRLLEVEREGLDVARADLQRAEAEEGAAIAAAQQWVEQTRRSIDAARGAHESVAAVLRAHDERIRLLTSVAAALREADRAEEVVRAASESLREALEQHGFADADEVVRALEPLGERDRLQATILTHQEESVRVRQALLELDGVDPALEVDLVPASARLAEADQSNTAAASADGLAQRAVESATAHSAAVAAALRAIAQQLDESRTLVNLAQLVNGGVQNISLSLFAVSRRFHEVVDVANQRLAPMLGGRLTLEAHDDQLDGRSRFGLGLRVIDNYSGTLRETSTLSGGESFCCALALALGLAEVVMQASGALTIDTLFIDEGFGSLDPKTLDDVTVELNRLREGGRMVGLVSHVSEMKGQIHRQIRVTRIEGSHSTLEVVLP